MTEHAPAVDVVRRLEAPSTADPVAEIGVSWARASGTRVWDEDGREYLDLTAGSGVHNVGHNHPAVVRAIGEQLGALAHTGWQFPSPPRARLLERLAALVPFDDPAFILAVTGSEAMEAALKVARLATGRPAVLSFLGGFHGKTGGSLTVTANHRYRRGVSPLPSDILRLPFPEDGDGTWELDAIRRLLGHPDFAHDDVAAVVVEPVQGSSGMVASPPGFLAALRDLAHGYGALLVVDEIFSGFGRTGRMFGYEHDGAAPDVVVLGKALGGGLPVSAVAARAGVMASVPAYKQTSTFSGHPVACAAGVAVLDVIERERLVDAAAARGDQLARGLRDVAARSGAAVVTGKGMMLGFRIEAGDDDASQALAKATNARLRAAGVLALRGGHRGNVVKLTPPLTLSEDEVALVCERFEDALDGARRGP